MFSVDAVDRWNLGGQGNSRVVPPLAPGDGITKKNCVLRVIDKKLYVMKLEGVSVITQTAVPEFDRWLRQPLPKK